MSIFDKLRLSLMQDFLPIGIAIFERTKKNGAGKVVQDFSSPNISIEDLRVEGEPLARSLRDQLDAIRPGLGNPIMEVEIALDEEIEDQEISTDINLTSILNRIDNRLNLLNTYLNDYKKFS